VEELFFLFPSLLVEEIFFLFPSPLVGEGQGEGDAWNFNKVNLKHLTWNLNPGSHPHPTLLPSREKEQKDQD